MIIFPVGTYVPKCTNGGLVRWVHWYLGLPHYLVIGYKRHYSRSQYSHYRLIQDSWGYRLCHLRRTLHLTEDKTSYAMPHSLARQLIASPNSLPPAFCAIAYGFSLGIGLSTPNALFAANLLPFLWNVTNVRGYSMSSSVLWCSVPDQAGVH